MKKTGLRKICLAALFSALMAVSAQLAVPTVPPFTLQTFVLFLAMYLLGTKTALVSVSVYLALGFVGLPVFAGFRGGVSAFASATGGYLLGFVLAVLVAGAVMRIFGKKDVVTAISYSLGMLVCYIFGSAWYYVFCLRSSGTVGLVAIISQCVLPFIPFDAIKIAFAIFIGKKLRKVFAL